MAKEVMNSRMGMDLIVVAIKAILVKQVQEDTVFNLVIGVINLATAKGITEATALKAICPASWIPNLVNMKVTTGAMKKSTVLTIEAIDLV